MRDPHDTCLEIENHLPLWAGSDLEPDVQASVESHLARCEGCARAAVQARAARVALEWGLRTRSERMGAGRDPWPTIRASLRAEGLVGSAEAAPIARPVFRRWSPAWPIAAAVLVGLFLAGTWLPSGSDPTQIPGVVPKLGAPTVAIPARLRRLSPGEPRMRDTAWLFRPTASPDAIGSGDATPLAPAGNRYNTAGSPVSLERVQLLPPR